MFVIEEVQSPTHSNIIVAITATNQVRNCHILSNIQICGPVSLITNFSYKRITDPYGGYIILNHHCWVFCFI